MIWKGVRMEGVSCVILAGGKGRRMGGEKAFVPLRGLPLFEHVYRVCGDLFEEIIIVTNDPDRFTSYRAIILKDLIPGIGPLGGLYTGLLTAKNEYCFCAACDLPFLRKELIRYLLSQREGYDAVIPSTPDGLHPLLAVYSKGALREMMRVIEDGKSKVSNVLNRLKVRFCTAEEMAPYDPSLISLFNVNDLEDLRRAEELMKGEDIRWNP
ncbi:MAG: molybdenum cofactor guanylyltransferase [Deltaproteobacteria bacterium]|nr:MAG: molybdenum cofactor guanylyltransferase [Deltaproteobacteria bacterium]